MMRVKAQWVDAGGGQAAHCPPNWRMFSNDAGTECEGEGPAPDGWEVIPGAALSGKLPVDFLDGLPVGGIPRRTLIIGGAAVLLIALLLLKH